MTLPELSNIHDEYLALCRVGRAHFGGVLGGKLVLRTGFDADGVAVVVASCIAGAAALCVDNEAENLRQGLRAGLCDFVVGNLDEALRILKNEVRRGLPVSVGLAADPVACLAAMVERGVQPDLISGPAIRESSMGAFAARGAVVIVRDEADSELDEVSTSLLGWSVATDGVRILPLIGRMAAESLHTGRSDTADRWRWLTQAPRYLGRSFGPRMCVRMDAAESTAFLARVRMEIPAAALTRDGAAL
jgi:hypothetical protein